MKTLTFKIRDLKPGETAVTKQIAIPDQVLQRVLKEAAGSQGANDCDVILLTITCKIDVMVAVEET